MRFLADMGVAMRSVEWLREQGHDATHLREENLQRMSDADVFRKAATEGRILVTFDLDFGEIVALSSEKKASVVLFRLHNTRTPHVIEPGASGDYHSGRVNFALAKTRLNRSRAQTAVEFDALLLQFSRKLSKVNSEQCKV